MRFLVIVKADARSEAGELPTEEELATMGAYNDELVEAGVMLAADGLHPTSRGAKVKFPERTVIDGPFTEAKELIAGYWIWEVASKDEAIAWLKRAPCPYGEVELRQIFDLDDLPMSPETRRRFEAQQARIDARRR